MNFKYLLFSFDAGIATLSLNRPERLNSFNREMQDEMMAALHLIHQLHALRVLVLTAEGRSFCAGQDLNERSVSPEGLPPDLALSLEQFYNPMIRQLRTLPVPVICAVNGVAAGAGANIALACDLVLAARSSSFIQAFCSIGLIPDSGGTWTLPRLVGMPRAKALSLLGLPLGAEHAEQYGLIYRCVDDAQLQDEVQRLATHFAQQPTYALGLIKQALNASFDHSFEQQLELETNLQQLAGRTADYLEGVHAFMEKRSPVFQGR